MTRQRRHAPDELYDPLELVLDLLVNLAATAIAGGLTVAARRVWQSRHAQPLVRDAGVTAPQLHSLRERLTHLDALVDRASAVVEPARKRELGGQLLLTQQQLQEYYSIRNSLFEEVKSVDGVLEGIPSSAQVDGDTVLPQELKAQVKFIEAQLRQARAAGLAEESFLNVKAAIAGMRRMMDRVESLRAETSDG